MVEDAAYHDGVVGGIVVAEVVTGPFAAPGHPGTRQQSVKEAGVEVLKYRFQIVGVTLGGIEALSSAHLADQVGLLTDAVAGDIASIPCGGLAVDWTPVHFGQQ